MCGGLTSQPTFDIDTSSMQRRTKDPKTSVIHSGIRGIERAPWRRWRWIPSISSCSRDNFGRKSVVFVRRAAQPRKEWPFRAFFFLTAPLTITSYHTNKTSLAEAPFGPGGDDNGPGSEPPPRNRIGIATAIVPSRRRPPADPGKPSFPRFKVYYLPRRRVRFEPRPLDLRQGDLHDEKAYGRSEDICTNIRKPRIG